MRKAKATGLLLLACAATAGAATEAEIRRAFEQAQKKGAVAVYEERCGGNNTIHFSGSTAEQIAKVSAALTAMAASRDREAATGCSGGLQAGESRFLDLYPDGTVKVRGQ